MSFTTHNTFLFFSTILCLVPKTLALETLLDRGCYSKFLDLENSNCFLAHYIPEISASACFGLSHFIFIQGRSLPVLSDFILSASACEILLKSSSSLKSSSVMLLDTPLKTKTLPFFVSAEWYDLGSYILTFSRKLVAFFPRSAGWQSL